MGMERKSSKKDKKFIDHILLLFRFEKNILKKKISIVNLLATPY